MEDKRREPGLDLLRALGLLAVVSFHFFLYNGFYARPQTGLSMAAADVALTLTISCNGIFMMLTGYLKCEKRPTAAYYRSLLPLLTSYFLASLGNLAFRTFYLHEALDAAAWIRGLLNFSGAYYGWYVEMYLGLHLLAPVLNLALERLEGKKQMLWLLGTLVLVTVLPAESKLLPDYWVKLYPLAYYCAGAAIRKHRPAVSSGLCLLSAVLTALTMGLISFLAAGGEDYRAGYAPVFGGMGIFLQTTLLFLGLYRVRLPRHVAGLVRLVAIVSFEAYLISYLFDRTVYRLWPSLLQPGRYLAAWGTMTAPAFLLSCLAGGLLHAAAKGILALGGIGRKRIKIRASSRR